MAVDPGGTTGIATLTGQPRLENLKAWRIELGPWPEKGKGDPDKADVLYEVKAFCAAHKDGVVIVERFHTAQRGNRYSHFTVEEIGAIEGVCFTYGTELHLVINKQRKRFIPIAERILGVPHNPVPHHDRDDVAALGHLLTFIHRIGVSIKGLPEDV
jgi:hypothetical protein